ncbi:MAG: hypothetical protein M1836_004757 [Candelina mexicana]|nr:MAG: hypothetical protein M1836_004757 [Candelina mexicana]
MAQSADRSMESRVGRNKQRYGPQGERLVAGVVPLSADKTKVLVIQSTRRGGWVLPKGGWETDETAAEAACREAWEEAGAVCRVEYDLGQIAEMRPAEQLTPQAPKALYQFFQCIVDREEPQWPEMHKRARMWMSHAEATQALANRPELLDALNRSQIVR